MNTKNLRTIARLTSDLQRPFAEIAAAVDAQGIMPAMRLNDVAYFDGDAVSRIGQLFPRTLEAAPESTSPQPPRSLSFDFVGECSVVEAAPAADGASQGPPRFSMVAYSGGPMRPKMTPPLKYPVVVDLKGLDTSNQAIPAIKDHDPQMIVGHTETVGNDGRQLTASGVLSGTGAAAREVTGNAKNGFPWKVSIFADVRDLEFIGNGQNVNVNGRVFAGPLYVARSGVLHDVSFLSRGADGNTSVRIAAAPNDDNAPDPTSEETESLIDQERDRVRSIGKIVGKYRADIEAPRLSKIEANAIDGGWTPDRTELELIRGRRPSAGNYSVSAGSRRSVDSDYPTESAVLEASLGLSSGLTEKFLGTQYNEHTLDAAMSAGARGATIHSIIRATLRAAAMGCPDRIGDAEIRSVFDADRMLRMEAGGASTISLTNVLSNVQNKSLLMGYQAVQTTWQTFCSVGDLKDFKPGLRLRLFGNGKFLPVAPDGDLKHMSVTDQGYNLQLDTEGAIIGLTRKMIINDDQQSLTQVPMILGRAGALALERCVYTLLVANTGNFFSSGNGNLITGGPSALSVDGLTAAEMKFLQQVDDNGEPILVAPSSLLVPPELSTTANVLTRSAEIRDAGATAKYTTENPHAGRFSPSTSPWLSNAKITGHSATAWYLFSAPTSGVAAMCVGFLNGQHSPTVQTAEADFSTLGMQSRAFFDFGAAFEDPRGGVKSAGV